MGKLGEMTPKRIILSPGLWVKLHNNECVKIEQILQEELILITKNLYVTDVIHRNEIKMVIE